MEQQPYREPLSATLLRTFTIAIVLATVLSSTRVLRTGFPIAFLLMLWPSFGGHWVEIFFLNLLRPRVPSARAIQILARLAVWFVGGVALAWGFRLTAHSTDPTWLPGGVIFIGIELIAHLVLMLRGKPSFYDGGG